MPNETTDNPAGNAWDRLQAWGRQVAPEPAPGAGEAEALAQHRALREGVALGVVPGWAPILVEGTDAIAYLHRRLSNSIASLPLGHGRHALQLEGDGRIQAEFLVYRGDEACFLLTPHAQAATAWEPLEKFTLVDDVQVTRLWESETILTLAGPHAPAVLAELVDQRGPAEALAGDPWHALFTITVAGFPARVFGDGRWSVPLYHLAIPHMALLPAAEAVLDSVVRHGGRAVGAAALELLRIDSGVTLHGVDTTARTIPLDAGLYEAIDFDKGCYPGQEFMARINNLGHPARVPVRLDLEGEHTLEADTLLEIDGQEAGTLSSAATLPGLARTAALGYLKWDAREAAEATLRAGDARLTARLTRIRPRAEAKR